MEIGALLEPVRSFLAHQLCDAYVISFVKCGRTWLRMLLTKYYSHALDISFSADFATLWRDDRSVPLVRFTHADSNDEKYGEFDFNFKRLASKQIIYLYRDPRDILISYYFQLTHRHKRLDPDTLLADYVRDELFGLPRIVNFMNLMVEQLPRFERCLCLTYEGIHEDTAGILRSVVTFLGTEEVDQSAVEWAVEQCRFERMKEMERKQQFEHVSLRFHDPDDPRSYKVRRGKVGGFCDYLGGDDLVFVNDYLKHNLHPMYKVYESAPCDPL